MPQALEEDDYLNTVCALLPVLDDRDSFVYLNALLALQQLLRHCFLVGCDLTSRENTALSAVLGLLMERYGEGGMPALPGKEEEEVEEEVEETVSVRRRAMVGQLLLQFLRTARASVDLRPPLPSLLALRGALPRLKLVCISLARQRLTLQSQQYLNRGQAEDEDVDVSVDLKQSMTLRLSHRVARCLFPLFAPSFLRLSTPSSAVHRCPLERLARPPLRILCF